jgi:putative transposase
MTPAVVHLGKAADLLVQRQAVLDTAFQIHPERFVRQPPKPLSLPTAVWINKPPDQEKTP